MAIDRAYCQQLDKQGPLAEFKTRFQSSQKHTIFLDANSMGAMPATVPDDVALLGCDFATNGTGFHGYTKVSPYQD